MHLLEGSLLTLILKVQLLLIGFLSHTDLLIRLLFCSTLYYWGTSLVRLSLHSAKETEVLIMFWRAAPTRSHTGPRTCAMLTDAGEQKHMQQPWLHSQPAKQSKSCPLHCFAKCENLSTCFYTCEGEISEFYLFPIINGLNPTTVSL